MKFAKELEDDLVPEWRVKYLNYKQGKKKVKAISRALKNANRSPKTPGRPPLQSQPSYQGLPFTNYDFTKRDNQQSPPTDIVGRRPPPISNENAGAHAQLQRPRRMSTTMFAISPPINPQEDPRSESEHADGERTPLNKRPSHTSFRGRYGSFDGSGPDESVPQSSRAEPHPLPELELPDPALTPTTSRNTNGPISSRHEASGPSSLEPQADGHKHHMSQTGTRHRSTPFVKRLFQKNKSKQYQDRKKGSPGTTDPRRVFTPRPLESSPAVSDVQLEAYKELDARQDDFFEFLDKELAKVDKFYRMKEDEARVRLHALRAQLHEHRDQRMRDMGNQINGDADPPRIGNEVLDGVIAETPLPTMPLKEPQRNGSIFDPIEKVIHLKPKVGKTSKAMEHLASPPGPQGQHTHDPRSDFVRKKSYVNNETVPHRYAKRRLKLALQEFYRGLELLKSYSLLNREGFRKINKKYDKAVNARPPLRYQNEKVNEAYFVKSTALDEYLMAVEDLYARYFERGNRKVAVSKLRSSLREGDHSGSSFRNGLFLAAGSGLGIAGLVSGVGFLYNDNARFKEETSYLLQLYAGYFLSLLLFLIFVIDCKVWTMARVNYVFIFEYDTRHVLDWRQLAEIPCFFLFLNGLFIWLNFQFNEASSMYLYWPILLFGITLIILALPFRVLYYRARKWWAFSNFRLLFAGLYPVEFRDFFLGDMYCSETYAMSQIELFFCLYVHNWDYPPRCNSNHSMLLGFFTTLPAIWRFLQCVRRYYDSRNWFPHLANCAKYLCNILYYMTLSLYRLHVTDSSATKYRTVFIVFAAINGLYCSLWDVFMDWSLGDIFSKNFLLRNRLAYRKKSYYYFAIVVDVVLRHQWICYAIFTHDLQHSAAMSFFVGLAEVLRRGLWTLFRVENEHCNNVGKFRASRDIPLPYALPESPSTTSPESYASSKRRKTASSPQTHSTSIDRPIANAASTGADLERQETRSSDLSLRRRSSIMETPALRALHRVGTVIAAAHAQDFTKRRRDAVVGDDPHDERMLMRRGNESSDEEDDPMWDDHEMEPSLWEDRGTGPNVDVPGMVDGQSEADVTEARRLKDQAGSSGGPS